MHVRELRHRTNTTLEQTEVQAECHYDKGSSMINMHMHAVPFEIGDQVCLNNRAVKWGESRKFHHP